jgi:hypothetical protein
MKRRKLYVLLYWHTKKTIQIRPHKKTPQLRGFFVGVDGFEPPTLPKKRDALNASLNYYK